MGSNLPKSPFNSARKRHNLSKLTPRQRRQQERNRASQLRQNELEKRLASMSGTAFYLMLKTQEPGYHDDLDALNCGGDD